MSHYTKLGVANTHRLREFGRKCLGVLDADEAEAVHIAMGDIVTEVAGTELVTNDASLDSPSLLLEGWAVRQRLLWDGRRQIFGFILPGEAIGLFGRQNKRAPCAIVALTDVSILPLPVLGQAMQSRQGELFHWGQDMLNEEETSLYDQVMRLGRQSAYERMAHQLLDFYYRLSHAGLTEDHSFTLPFTQEVLSDALGLSTVHTNRTLQQMRRDRLIESQGQHVRLLDMGGLKALSDYQPPERVMAVA